MNISNQPAFVVFTTREGSPPEPQFAFHAPSLDAASSMKGEWARYHGQLPSEFGVEENPAWRELNVTCRDDYVSHRGRATKMVSFYEFRSPDDGRPLVVEAHVVSKTPGREDLGSLLREVAVQQFGGHPYKIWEEMSSTSKTHSPIHGLAAEALDTGNFIVPVLSKKHP